MLLVLRISRDLVFPARAGMIRHLQLNEGERQCFPRPRGDDPLAVSKAATALTFSPPARG